MATFIIDDDLIIDAKFAFGHSREVRLHDNLAGNMGGQDLSLRTH